jgi:hypothetical protein
MTLDARGLPVTTHSDAELASIIGSRAGSPASIAGRKPSLRMPSHFPARL